MLLRPLVLTFTLSAVLSGTTVAQTIGFGLAQANNCVACHQLDRKRVGPAFTVIAERFKGDVNAVPYLSDAIRNGGRNRWGAVPMPAQPHVTSEEADALATWILSLSQDQ